MECLGYLKYCSLSRLTLTTSQDSQYTSETISASILPTLQWFISKHGPEIFINHFSTNHSQSTQQAVTEVIFLLLYSKNSLLFSFAESRSIAYLLKNYSSFFLFCREWIEAWKQFIHTRRSMRWGRQNTWINLQHTDADSLYKLKF